MDTYMNYKTGFINNDKYNYIHFSLYLDCKVDENLFFYQK